MQSRPRFPTTRHLKTVVRKVNIGYVLREFLFDLKLCWWFDGMHLKLKAKTVDRKIIGVLRQLPKNVIFVLDHEKLFHFLGLHSGLTFVILEAAFKPLIGDWHFGLWGLLLCGDPKTIFPLHFDQIRGERLERFLARIMSIGKENINLNKTRTNWQTNMVFLRVGKEHLLDDDNERSWWLFRTFARLKLLAQSVKHFEFEANAICGWRWQWQWWVGAWCESLGPFARPQIAE